MFFCITSGDTIAAGEFFSTGFMQSDRSVVVSGSQPSERTISELMKYRDGRFSAYAVLGEDLCAWTDDMAQDTIYYHVNSLGWGISNSLLGLARQLRKEGVSLSFDHASFASFRLGSGGLFGGQLTSHNTPIKEIKVLPSTQYLVVSGFQRASSTLVVRQKPERDDRLATISEYVAETVGLVRSLRDCYSSIDVDLSGGRDSRASFAVAYLALSGREGEYRVHSNKRLVDDYAIAGEVIRSLGLSEGWTSGNGDRGSAMERYDLWKLGCVGVSLNLSFPNSTALSKSLRVHGGNFRAVSYARRPAEKMLSKWERDLRHKGYSPAVIREFRDQFVEAVEMGEVGIDSSEAMHFHYAEFRSRFHYGREGFKQYSKSIITPLLSFKLVDLYRTSYRKGRVGMAMSDMNSMLSEIVEIVDPSLARFGYKGEGWIKQQRWSDWGWWRQLRRGWRSNRSSKLCFKQWRVSCEQDGSEKGVPDCKDRSHTGGGERDLLLRDVVKWGDTVVKMGIVSEPVYREALSELSEADRPLGSARSAWLVVSAGEILAQCK